MFRNRYLETYKRATLQENSIQILLCHFSYLHLTLGSVLQDLQYQIGKSFAENSYKNQISQSVKTPVVTELDSKIKLEHHNIQNIQVRQTALKKYKQDSIKEIQTTKQRIKPMLKPKNQLPDYHRMNQSFDELFSDPKIPIQKQKIKEQNLKEKNKFQNVKNDGFVGKNAGDFFDEIFKIKQ